MASAFVFTGVDDIGLDEIMERHRQAGAGGAHPRRI